MDLLNADQAFYQLNYIPTLPVYYREFQVFSLLLLASQQFSITIGHVNYLTIQDIFLELYLVCQGILITFGAPRGIRTPDPSLSGGEH